MTPSNMNICANSGGMVFPITPEQRAIKEVKTLRSQLETQASELDALKQMVSALLARDAQTVSAQTEASKP